MPEPEQGPVVDVVFTGALMIGQGTAPDPDSEPEDEEGQPCPQV